MWGLGLTGLGQYLRLLGLKVQQGKGPWPETARARHSTLPVAVSARTLIERSYNLTHGQLPILR